MVLRDHSPYRTCKQCNFVKPLEDFQANGVRSKVTGELYRRRICVPCEYSKWVSYREARKENARQRTKIWVENNRAKRNETTRRRQARQLNATPSWANKKKIQRIYERAQKHTKTKGIRYEDDHIVPLKSKIVCGLHCESNLRVITKQQNQFKLNRKWPDMP